MDTDSLIAILHTNQLPYKRIYAGDFIYELAPKKTGFNHKIPTPDMLRELIGENISINITSLSDTNSLWHSILYAVLTEKYTNYNWHYRKIMAEKFTTALDERLTVTFARHKNIILKGSNLKQENITFKNSSPEAMFYMCLVLNINIVVFTGGMVDKMEYHFPTPVYDVELPLVLLYCDDRQMYSVIHVNEQTIHSLVNAPYVVSQIAKVAPKQHKVLKHYATNRCLPDVYAKINGLTAQEIRELELMKLKITELKELAHNLGLSTKGRTKQALVEQLSSRSF